MSPTVDLPDEHVGEPEPYRVKPLTMPTMGAQIDEVLERAGQLRTSTNTVLVATGTRHWVIFADLCRTLKASGDMIPDCYIAALAIERKATLVSRDTFFARVPGLKWMDLPGT